MSKSLWSGKKPKTGNEARLRLCEAALECIWRNGLIKTTMSDIAKEAGVARPTLYKYFKNKTDIFIAGIDTVAYTFTETVVAHARQFLTFEERVIETIIYVVTQLPNHKYLSLVLNTECATALKDRAFMDEATLIFLQMTATPLLELKPDLESEGVDITEFMSRIALSIILFPGKYSTDHQSLREMIKKRLLPGLI